jgi:hypothetical protein
MGSNQQIRRKKKFKKFLDVKLLTTNRTTVVGLNSLKSLNLTNVYPNNNKNKKNKKNNNKVKSKPLQLRSRVKSLSVGGKVLYSCWQKRATVVMLEKYGLTDVLQISVCYILRSREHEVLKYGFYSLTQDSIN